MASERAGTVPFQAHVELLQEFLGHRDALVERIQAVLNAQGRPAYYLQDRAQLSRAFEDCFFTLPALSGEAPQLRGQLQQAHWASGFRPRIMPGIPNDMFDPADMMVRAFRLWSDTRWPGRNGRLRYAQALFNLYVVRCLTLLDMRLCDEGAAEASARLAQVQALLDALWKTSPADQPVLVRDARWLVPVAQSPTTDDLGAYFEAAGKIATCLPEADRIEIHRASVLMAGGHLRSQLRHFNMQGTAIDDPALVLSTRGSNALDFAMTIQGLVTLLKAYEGAIGAGDGGRRTALAAVIGQGISVDPQLFVNRVDLLAAYSMIEHLFVAADATGRVAWTRTGERHVRLVHEYAALVARLAKPLHEDCLRARPVRGSYSPYGVMYGFSSNLMEHMVMKTLQPDAEIRFSLEDVFTDGGADKLAWVSGWRKLPHINAEVLKLYEYPQQFAEDVFARVEQALRDAASRDAGSSVRTGRLHVATSGDAQAAAPTGVAQLPVEYVRSSDRQLIAAHQAQPVDEARLLTDRREGMFAVSYQVAGGWVGITKDFLTGILGTGQDARIVLPAAPAAVLRLMYQDLIVA
ncbi:MAG: hypothetical protein WDO12_06915 [Pseudomonadota bacterium]